MHLNKKTNKLIAEFMGYIYYHSGVDIDNSDCGGIYEKTEVFSKVPILVNDYDECVYFKDVPNPDYRKVNTMWNNDIEFISWSTLNYKDYITDLKYHSSFDWLIPVCHKWDNLFFDSDDENIIKYTKLSDDLDMYTSFYEIEPIYNQLIKNIEWYNSICK